MSCILRIILNSVNSLDEFKSIFSDNNIEIRHLNSDKSKYVILLEFNENIILDTLESYIEANQSDIISYRFIISIDTEYDTRIIDVPDNVVEAIRRLGGDVRFKYTFIDEDMDEDMDES
ncbi:MAG: hypothetical protein ETSY2_20715 [Candidatus Entotheonella gemina]|uniref:ACT domain-containing protein n=2 Tax=Candidatus Entotheonella TaxID=93171 RepID=W4M676_9BACT|nr:MAG: hypothetical protein ETSY2_20715 [Candidatus Entotheonella gemina]